MLKKFRAKVNSIVNDQAILFNIVLIGLAILLGAVVRFNFISGTDFPLNDGGLFYQMVEDLLGNKLAIPKYTIYNQDAIPFAYPPFAFYLVAVLNILTKISLFSLLRYVPVIISIITILAFYYLAREIIKDQLMGVISTVLFAVVPRAFEWFVMGGGITRALGFFFAILSIQAIWQMYEDDRGRGGVFKAALFSGLTVLSHPETALFVVFTAFALILYHGITKERILKSLAVAAGVLVIISPWVIGVISKHGFAPFSSAGTTGHSMWFEIKNVITLNFGFENGEFLSVFTGLTLLAVFIRRDKLAWALFGLLVFGYLLFPRSGPNFLTIWVSLLAALGLKEVLFAAAKNRSSGSDLINVIEVDGKAKIILILVIFYLFLGAYTYKFISGKDTLHLTKEIHQTFKWIEANTDSESSFLMYPSSKDNRFWWNDYLSEWFPVITKRNNVSTVQGYEWVPENFEQKVISYIYLRSCGNPGPVCIETWEEFNNKEINYVVIDLDDDRPDFVNSFKLDKNYDLFFDGDRLVVFSKK